MEYSRAGLIKRRVYGLIIHTLAGLFSVRPGGLFLRGLRTFYTQRGDYFAIGCAILTAAILAAAFICPAREYSIHSLKA